METLTNEQLQQIGYGMMDRLLEETKVQDTLYWLRDIIGPYRISRILEKAIADGTARALGGKT